MVHGFLVGAEIEESVDLDVLMNKIADAIMIGVTGIGTLNIEHLGALEFEGASGEDTTSAGMVELNVGARGLIES